MFCPNCGKNLPANARFCDNCGSTLSPPAAAQSAYNPQPNYRPQSAMPSYPAPMVDPLSRPLTVGNYIAMYLLMLIPIANIVLLFVWAFGSNTNINKKNWARAALLLALIGIAINILLWSLGVSILKDIAYTLM